MKIIHKDKGILTPTGKRYNPLGNKIETVYTDESGDEHVPDGTEKPVEGHLSQMDKFVEEDKKNKMKEDKMEETKAMETKKEEEQAQKVIKETKLIEKHTEIIREMGDTAKVMMENAKSIPEIVVPKITFPDHFEEQKQWKEEVLKALSKEITIHETNLKPIIDAIERIHFEKFPTIPEPKDYTDLLKEIKKALPENTDLSGVIQAIQSIPQTVLPDFQFTKDGRLKVEVDRIATGGSGYSSPGDSIDVSTLATEETLQALKTAVENQTIELSAGGTALLPPTSVTAIAGAIGSGTVDNVKYHDGTYLVGNEVAGNGLTLEFVFDFPVGKVPDSLHFHGRYEGGGTHYMFFEVYDYLLTSWVDVTDVANRITDGTADATIDFTLNNPNFVSATQSKVRITHNAATYNNAHRLYIDYINLQYQSALDVQVDVSTLATETTLQAVLAASGGGGVSSYSFMQDSPSAESGYFYTVKIDSADKWLMVRDPSDGATPRKFANIGNNATVELWDEAWTNRATLTYTTLDNITL